MKISHNYQFFYRTLSEIQLQNNFKQNVTFSQMLADLMLS